MSQSQRRPEPSHASSGFRVKWGTLNTLHYETDLFLKLIRLWDRQHPFEMGKHKNKMLRSGLVSLVRTFWKSPTIYHPYVQGVFSDSTIRNAIPEVLWQRDASRNGVPEPFSCHWYNITPLVPNFVSPVTIRNLPF
jgi:hypothetical protein